MQLTPEQARQWIRLFPSHPAFWLAAAAILVAVFARRPPPERTNAEISAASSTAGEALRAARDRHVHYAWLSRKARAAYLPLAERLAPPDGFTREPLPNGSFGDWLRYLPACLEGAAVLDGKGKAARPANDPAIACVIDLAPTNRGLLNAANMALRLRAEFLWAAHRTEDISFCFTSGVAFPWERFAAGERPVVEGRNVQWKRRKTSEKPPEPRVLFAGYLESLLPYTSSISLEHDTIAADGQVRPGDLFLVVGRPGHVVQVLDSATGPGGERRCLLGEGLTPPVSFHVVRASDGSAWFRLDRGAPLHLPTWNAPIPWKAWRRWRGES